MGTIVLGPTAKSNFLKQVAADVIVRSAEKHRLSQKLPLPPKNFNAIFYVLTQCRSNALRSKNDIARPMV